MSPAKPPTRLSVTVLSRTSKDAIEHFVGTGGAPFDDPDYMKYNKTLSGWVNGVCPS